VIDNQGMKSLIIKLLTMSHPTFPILPTIHLGRNSQQNKNRMSSSPTIHHTPPGLPLTRASQVGDSKVRTTLYKVRWQGYDKKDDTWEPITHLQGYVTMVKAFKESHAKDLEKLAADRLRAAEKKATDDVANTPKHTVLSMLGLTSPWTINYQCLHCVWPDRRLLHAFCSLLGTLLHSFLILLQPSGANFLCNICTDITISFLVLFTLLIFFGNTCHRRC
jgi:hypothetical protein